jgi:hypothetical protein
MYNIIIEKSEALSIPKVKQWIENFNLISFSEKEITEDDVQVFCSFGYFVPKSHNGDKFEEISEMSSKMLFQDRLNFEISKVRVSLTVKIGNFTITDRLPKGIIFESVKKVVAELTKVKMTVESEYYNIQEVKESIPEFDKSIIDFEIVKDVVKNDYNHQINFDVDDILDKISKQGIDSLSEEEKQFLDSKSKE